MSLYDISLFLHVVGAFGLVAALAIESVSSGGPRRLGGPTAGLVVLTGIYMSIVRWRGQAWTTIALAALILIAVLGAVSAKRVKFATVSLRLRWALVTGIAFLMTVKPGPAGAIAAIVLAVVVGLGAAVPAWRAGAREARV